MMSVLVVVMVAVVVVEVIGMSFGLLFGPDLFVLCRCCSCPGLDSAYRCL